MKKNLLLLAFICNMFYTVYAQSDLGINQKENWTRNWTEFNSKKKDYNQPEKILAGIISENTTLSNTVTYLLQGTVYVTNNATLTIEEGAIIRGDYDTCGTLVIAKGSKIMAEGSQSSPIVFTTNKDSYSRKPGDWGGIIIMGDAPVSSFGKMDIMNFDLDPTYNRFGGQNAASSSGVIKYVRVEYAGKKSNSKKQISGITFAGVGSGTKIENVQVSFSDSKSFEFYGGNVKIEKLVSYRASDDDFAFTQGVQANFSNSMAIRHPYSSNINQQPRCLEIKAYNSMDRYDGQVNKTTVIATNLTLVNTEDNSQGLVKEAVFVSKEASLTLNNSVVYGFKDFLMVDEFSEINEFEKFIKLKNLVIAHCSNNFSTTKDEIIRIDTDFLFSKNNITVSDGLIGDHFKSTDVALTPDFRYSKIEAINSRVVLNNN